MVAVHRKLFSVRITRMPRAYFQEERIKLHSLKTADGAEEAKKVEEKWSKAPPVEHFDRQHFVEYFPQLFYDLRYQKRIRKCSRAGRICIVYTLLDERQMSLTTRLAFARIVGPS